MLGFKKTEEIYRDKTINGSGLNVLNIETTSVEVILSTHELEDISIELKGEISPKLIDNLRMDVTQQGNALNVQVKIDRDNAFSFGIEVIKLELKVGVPGRLYDEITVETSSGGVEAADLEGKKVKFKASSGEVDAARIKAHTEFKCKTNSGGIQLNGIDAPSINAKANSGTILLQNLTADDIQARASSGKVIGKKWTGNITAESNSGGIDLHSAELTGNIDAEASSGDVMLYFDNKPQSFTLDFSGSSGEAHLELDGIHYEKKKDHRIKGTMGDGRYTIKVNTSSGDFDFRS
ncbi:DUF4097 domain-containing protein [Rossellomorea vietnamensis]|uniref:DUF4097 domain-containing protein n=1 Tax=Rossellomorea vietnamensis TaxID=218284 RepID=A0A5D4MEL9_9BACI|nr:DUF4097 family beta strand repeat-containing protein [Rossellomorea vietnamensis]TYR99938.1 DUF4097 domain-containing protein [Rossellomorea vietnamensis]